PAWANLAARTKKKSPRFRGLLEENPGSVLLSHTASRAVPSAPKSLTSEFGMGSGVASSKSPPETFGFFPGRFVVLAFGNERECDAISQTQPWVRASHLCVSRAHNEFD